jgi:hypothetical protein
MVTVGNLVVNLSETTYVELELHSDVEQVNPQQRVPGRDFRQWWNTITRTDIYGFRMFSKLEAEIPSIPSVHQNRSLQVTSDPFNPSTFHFCNCIVMPWPYAKQNFRWVDDPRLIDHNVWSGAFFRAPWRNDILVYYSLVTQKIYPATYNLGTIFRMKEERFVVEESLNSSFIQA